MEQDRSITCELVLECCTPSGDSFVVGEVYAVLCKEILWRQCVNNAANLGRQDACAGEQLQEDARMIANRNRGRRRIDINRCSFYATAFTRRFLKLHWDRRTWGVHVT